jgi:molecular chaperone DnaJ
MDFYATLGLDQTASTADIKRAYRRLARRYHPGVNPGDRAAEAMFRRVAEAYETLVDPARRQVYDASGGSHLVPPPVAASATLEFTEFDFSSAARGAQAATFTELFAEVLHPVGPADGARPEPGADVHASVTVEFLEALRGVTRQVVVVRQVVCSVCGRRGQLITPESRCGHCQGGGSIRWARGHMVFAKTCPACSGTGRQSVHRCAPCGGHGRTVRSDAVAVPVPPGAADGDRLRIAERGHAGRNGGRNGDLYVTVRVQPHPVFRRDGDDLRCAVPVAVHEAVLGARIDVPTLDGPVKLRIPPGTQAGREFRLRERGAPGVHGVRGDLVVEVQVVLPPAVDDRSRELIREFGERNPADVRRHLFST